MVASLFRRYRDAPWHVAVARVRTAPSASSPDVAIDFAVFLIASLGSPSPTPDQ